jgi:hypothetical protein
MRVSISSTFIWNVLILETFQQDTVIKVFNDFNEISIF